MTDRPILFSAPMVRALLGGRKTQTRRVLKFQPAPGISIIRKTIRPLDAAPYHSFERRSVYGNYAGELDMRIKRGDRLYVREHWRCEARYDDSKPSELKDGIPIYYVADPDPRDSEPGCAGRFRQGMHMPRWASRLTLNVTDVRVERLQDISEADARAEGVEYGSFKAGEGWVFDGDPQGRRFFSARDAYAALWDHINGPGAWGANPWVAVYTFTVTPKNIDEA